MDDFQKEFVMGFFLDNDSVSTVNRLAIAAANVISESNDSFSCFYERVMKEFPLGLHAGVSKYLEEAPLKGMTDYYEQIVMNFSDEDFITVFRMKRRTVLALVSFLNDHIPPGIIPLDKKVHVFLMFLMTNLSYNETGKLFGLHKSSVSHIFNEIGTCLSENRHNFISWPSAEDQHVTRIKINSQFKFPNCVGFLDTCHLKVGVRRKKHDIILLQAVCDESLKFIDIHIGEPGKMKKYKVYKDSPLSLKLQNFVQFGNHILADSEYKLKMNLMTPFSSEEVLTIEEMKFNEIHGKAMSCIGHAFQLLKDKFCKLNHIEILKPEFVNILIYSACVLHNFILLHEESNLVKDEVVVCDEGVTIDADIVLNPVEKRQFLCNYINYIDSDSDTLVSR